MRSLYIRSRFIVLKILIVFFAAFLLPQPSTAQGLEKKALQVPSKFRKGPFSENRSLSLPKGFKVSVFAAGLKGPRFAAVGPDGVIYVSLPREGKIIALPDKDADGVADSVAVFAEGLERPHGLAFKGSELIVAEGGRVIRLKDENADLKADSRNEISNDIPEGGGHWTRSVAVSPDGVLFVSAGSSCNVCIEEDERRAAVLRLSGSKAYVYAMGLRNTVGLAFHPDTGDLWGVDNGRDSLGDDIPPEELNKIIEGGDYGWPYCYGDRVPDPEFGSERRCKDTIPPVVKMQAHSAPLGISFGKGLKFPGQYPDALFIGFHGSWDRSTPTGYKLVYVPFKKGRPSGGAADFVTGWFADGDVWGRPVMPVVGKDGALYLTDDYAGAVYRISIEK